MDEKNKYVDMSVKTALKLVKDGFLLLPDIQREYVWDMQDIEKLFESIVDGYPIGSCIFWKTNKNVINKLKPNLYFFIREYEQHKTKNVQLPEIINDDGDYYVVLDGQQRITSLNIAYFGSYTSFKGGRGRSKDNPINWIKRELYYNLDYYLQIESDSIDDEHPPKRFLFLSDSESKTGKYYKIKNLLAYDNDNALLRQLILEQYDEKIQDDLTKLYSRTLSSASGELIHYYCIAENTYDEALDIFVRVNSTGRKLSKSDLLFSTLIDGWKNGKKNIELLLESINKQGEGFNFTKDYLMRLMLVLVDAPTNLKIESFDKKTIECIRNNWNNIEISITNLTKLLVELGLSDGFITSYNATMPLVYFLYKGGSFVNDSKNEARKFLLISMAKGLFGVASNDALRKARNALGKLDCKKTSFSMSLFKDIILTGNRRFCVSELDVDYWLDNYSIGQSTYMLLTILYPELKLNQVSFHQDHCHPHSAFEKRHIKALGLSDDKILEWQMLRNKLPNLQFLEGRENEQKNKTPLKEWIASGNKIKYQPDISYELIDFESFYYERRKLIKDELMNIFSVCK